MAAEVEQGNPFEAAWADEAIILSLKEGLSQEGLQRFLGDLPFFAHEPAFTRLLPADEAALRSQLVRSALLAVKSDRPEDALASLNHAVLLGGKLSSAEGALFVSCTIRATVKAKSSMRMLSIGSPADKTEDELAMFVNYKNRIETEFQNKCLAQLGVLDKYLIPSASSESTVSYLRLKGHLLDFVSELHWSSLDMYKALSSYMTALEMAQRHLCPSNPESIKASLDLMWFLEYKMNDHVSAYDVARTARDAAYAIVKATPPEPSDMRATKKLLMILSDFARKLGRNIGVQNDVFPFQRRSKDLTRSPCPDYRGFNSTGDIGLGTSLLKLPANYVHPMIGANHDMDDIDAYLVGEGEEDFADAVQGLGAFNFF